MSNYTKTVDFAAKDTLPSGDSGKIIKGTEFETEFDNISTAIATKADLAGPTFTGILTFASLKGATGATVTTVLDEDDMATNSATALATQQSIKAYVDAQQDTVDTFAEILALSNTTGGTDIAVGTGDDITFADNSKAIFGAGSDLQIYHDGSNSIIYEGGTGDLQLRGNGGSTTIMNGGGTETLANFGNNGAVTLYYDNAVKLATSATGIDVTGSVTADGLTVESGTGNIGIVTKSTDQFAFMGFEDSTSSASSVYVGADGNDFIARANSLTRFRAASNGDISFYEDTGTTPKFVWDASAESLGIGTTTPGGKLEINGGVGVATTGGTLIVRQDGDTFTDGIALTSSNPASHRFWKDSSGKLNIGPTNLPSALVQDLSGNVGIGTDSPVTDLDVRNNISMGDGTSVTNLSMTRNSANYISASDAAGYLVFRTGSSVERVRITSTGNVKIGTASDRYSFLTASTANLQIDGGIVFDSGAGNNVEIFNYRATDMLFGNSGAEDMRIDSSGHAIIPAGVTLGTAAGVYAAANTLDDYEEGTWTPVLSAQTGTTPTMTQNNFGSYTKVGRLVSIIASIEITAISGTTAGILVACNLPFTANNNSGFLSAGSQLNNAVNFARSTNPGPTLANASSFGFLSSNNAGGGYAFEDFSIFSSSSFMRISLSYYAA